MKRGTPDHPKVAALAAILNIEHFSAVGILELLWHFTAKFSPAGDIGKHTDAAIAKAVGWKRPTGEKGVTPECRLSDALVDAKWLDRCPCHRLVVHDWSDHADQTVTRVLASRKLAFVQHDASLPCLKPIPKALPEPIPPAARDPRPPILEKWERDEEYLAFQVSYRKSSDSAGSSDWSDGYSAWRALDYTQKAAAVAGASLAGPFISLPMKYLRRHEWDRKPRPPAETKPKEKPMADQLRELGYGD